MCDAYSGNPMEFIFVVTLLLAILIIHINKNEIKLQVNSNISKFAYIKKQATQLQKEHRANTPFRVRFRLNRSMISKCFHSLDQ